MLTEMLSRLLESNGIPVVSVIIEDTRDRATWRVSYPPGTSPSVMAAGDALVAAFDPTAPAAIAAEQQAKATRLTDDVTVRALARVCWEEIQKCQPAQGQTLLTFPQFRARVLATLQGLL